MAEIYVDADACGVKNEVYRVAERYGIHVTLVANVWMRVPNAPWIELVVVGQDIDEADDWIVEHSSKTAIVVTDDIPLASRCLKTGARVLNAKGRVFSEHSIGDALATREVLSHLREHGHATGGPAPLTSKDRSQFLQRLDQLVQACMREE